MELMIGRTLPLSIHPDGAADQGWSMLQSFDGLGGLGVSASRAEDPPSGRSGRSAPRRWIDARDGFHCSVNGTSWQGSTGRKIVSLCVPVSDAMSRIQSTES